MSQVETVEHVLTKKMVRKKVALLKTEIELGIMMTIGDFTIPATL